MRDDCCRSGRDMMMVAVRWNRLSGAGRAYVIYGQIMDAKTIKTVDEP